MKRKHSAPPAASFPSKSVIIGSAYVLGSMLVIFLVSWIFSSLSHDILYLWLIPPVVAGVFFFLSGGIIIGIVSATVSSLIYHFVYPEVVNYSISLEMLDSVVMIAIGGISGYLSRVIRHKNWLLSQFEDALLERDALIEVLLTTNLRREDIENEAAKQKTELKGKEKPKFHREVVPDEGIFTVTISGIVSIEELKQAMVETTDDSKYSSEYNILVDLRNMKYTPIVNEVRELANLLTQVKDLMPSKVALIVKGDVVFAMAWLFCRLSIDMGFNIEVFRDSEKAKAWLSVD